jgi:hypothetical protein
MSTTFHCTLTEGATRPFLSWLCLSLIALSCAGCLLGKFDSVRGAALDERQTESEIAAKTDARDEKVVSKPVIDEPSGRENKKATDSSAWIVNRRALSKDGVRLRSPSKAILSAAVDQAKALGTVEKMKVCYRTDQGEWWISIYHHLGAAVDVKRFVWDRHSKTLKPFLVVKRVTKSKLDSELEKQDPGDSCEILTLRRGKR